MALKVKDIMKLKSWRGIEVIAGAGGLDRYVVSVGICDYEFIRGIDAEYRNAFEKDMVIFSSLLFAKDDHTQIMDMLKFFDKIQIACLVEKATILPELPKEALEYADAHDLPIFRMANDTYMDTVMLDIMDAVRSDDNNNFSEDIIDRIISNSLSKAQLYSICKNVSLNLKEYVMCVYIKSRSESFTMSIDGCLKKVYMNRNLNLKCLLFRYKDGIFVLMTGKNNTKKAFRIIIDELVAFLSPAGDDLLITESGIYKPYDDLDTCIRESYYTHVASIVEGKELKSYDKIGVYQFLIPLRNNDEMKRFTRRIIDPIIEMPEYFDTMKALTFTAGEFKSAAASLHCHHNTVRYRFQKVKEILECNNLSDIEFFGNLAMAVRLHIIYEIQNEILN